MVLGPFAETKGPRRSGANPRPLKDKCHKNPQRKGRHSVGEKDLGECVNARPVPSLRPIKFEKHVTIFASRGEIILYNRFDVEGNGTLRSFAAKIRDVLHDKTDNNRLDPYPQHIRTTHVLG